MIRYNPANQITIEEFKTPFEIKLNKNNRWVKLAVLIPWDKLAEIYYRDLSVKRGAPTVDARIVIGALIIKHMMNIDDREVIEMIRENMYMQYFLGLHNYTYKDVFDRSLFTTLRYRMGADKFDAMSCELINVANAKAHVPEKHKKSKGEQAKKDNDNQETKGPGEQNADSFSDTATSGDEAGSLPKNNGKLMMDATVADQMILYPTDLGLIAKSREESERLIDFLCQELHVEKPRTYRRNARQQYLAIAKKKRKTKRELHKGIGQQLRFLRRNIKSIRKLLSRFHSKGTLFNNRDLQIWNVIQQIYEQQNHMYKTGDHSIPGRIVNIYQPYVRPIVRGKEKAKVEFGSKISVSLHNGYNRMNKISWDAYNESTDLINQVEDYCRLNGCYPEVVIADGIYGTRENRRWHPVCHEPDPTT